MNQNVGKTDRILRIIAAVVLAGAGYYFHLWYLYVIAIVPLATAAMGFCPLYPMLKINTNKGAAKASPDKKPNSAPEKAAKKKKR